MNALPISVRHLWTSGLEWSKAAVFRVLRLMFAPHGRTIDAPPSRILVLQLQQLGDSVIFTPTLRALREHFPHARIDMLATPVAAQIYKKSPHVDQIHVASSWSTAPGGTRIRPMMPLLRRLRAERYEWAITDLAQQSFKYGAIAWLTGARTRIGFDIGGRGCLHNVRVPFREDAHWVDANLDIARLAGASPRSVREEVAFDAADVEHVRSLLTTRGYREGERLVAMHTGANWQSRTWYPERWAALADALAARHAAAIVFIGSAGEASHVESIRALTRSRTITLAGVTDIPQLAALCSIADLFVGTDSGPRQIARASGAPHVVVMSAQDDTDRWAGWATGELVGRARVPCRGCYFAHCAHKLCMDSIDAQVVLGWSEGLLSAASPRDVPARTEWLAVPPRLAAMEARGKASLRALAQSK